MATADVPHYEPLRQDLETDVCIVGAGIAGITTAYLLGRAGKRVVVLDDGPVGGGETARTTAQLSFALDDYYSKIEKMHGAEGARLAAESHMAAVDRIESIVREESIGCDFERLEASGSPRTRMARRNSRTKPPRPGEPACPASSALPSFRA